MLAADRYPTHGPRPTSGSHLADGTRPTIGLLVSIAHRHQPLWAGAVDAALAHDANLVCFLGGSMRGAPSHHTTGLPPRDLLAASFYSLVNPDEIDGLITWGGSGVGIGLHLSAGEMARFTARFAPDPIVNYEGRIAGIPRVYTDTYQGMRALLDHLITVHGRGRIVLIRGPEGHPETEERVRAYHDTLAAHSLTLDPTLVCRPGGWGTPHGAAMVSSLLDERRLRPGLDFDAIAATEIEYAFGAQQVLQSRGFTVPEQVAIVGFNDCAEAQTADPPITAMRKPFFRSGATAVEVLLQQIAGEAVPSESEIGVQLLPRPSCGCPAAPSEPDDSDVGEGGIEPATALYGIGMLAISREMMNATTLPQLSDAVAQRLPDLDVSACYLVLHQDPERYFRDGRASEWSDLILAYEGGRRIGGGEPFRRVRTHHLIADVLPAGPGARAWLAAPLHFGQHPYGVAFFEVGTRDGSFYQALVPEICSALQSVLLIQEHEQTKRSLRESEARMHTLIEHMPIEFWAKDVDGTYFMQNSALRSLVGDQVGLNLDQIDLDVETREVWREQDARVMAGETVQSEHTLQRDGLDRVYQQIVAPVKMDGQVIAIEGLLFDVTEQKELETSLRQATAAAEQAQRVAEEANQAKTRFLANMSHELRTPLTAVLGFSELMARDPNLTEEQRENLQIVRRSGTHLLMLIDDVLDLSKIEAGKVELQPKTFDLHDLLLGLGEMFSLRAEAKSLSLVFDLDQGVGRYVVADEGKLRQILINLLSNAIKFTETGGVRVNIAVSHTAPFRIADTPAPRLPTSAGSPQPETWLSIAVRDTGVGIHPAELDRVFDVFEQTESGRRTGQGTGLGLPISREYARMMGGEVSVSSEPGAGSTFSLVLPVEVIAGDHTAVAEAPPARTPVALAPGEPAYRVLIVDDAADNRRLLGKLLTPLGFQVRDASDGPTALALWQSWHPDLILLDLRLPGLNGTEVTRRIRTADRDATLPIVAMTASAFDGDFADLRAAGCDDVIRKPFSEATIFAVLTKHLNLRFVYELDGGPTETGSQQDARPAAEMPPDPDWVEKMQRATIEGDVQLIAQLVDEIRPSLPHLADRLTELAAAYAHDQILDLLKERR